MAFQLNTIEYGWETLNNEVSGSTPVSGSLKTIYIPETGSRTFLSADLEVYLRDANTGLTISNISTYQLSCSIDGNTTGQTVANTITMTGDHCSLGFKNSFTDLFNQRFTGSSHTIQPRLNFPQANSGRWNGHSFKFIITYQFDDANVDTMVKTVRLPLDAGYGALSATAMTVFGQKQAGYFNIPPLDTFLPESSKAIRDIWIEFRGVDASAAATSVSMGVQIDSGSTQTRFLLRGNMTTDTSFFDFENISGSIDTSVGHTLKASASLASRIQCVSPLLMCTYEYSSVSSTSILNSCIFPFEADYYAPNSDSFTATNGKIDFLIPEKDPSLVHSALIFSPLTTGATTRTYIVNSHVVSNGVVLSRRGVSAGMPTLNVRFDSGALTSANFTPRAGFNTLTFKTTNGAPQVAANSHTGYLLLNYSSSKLPNGVFGHNRTIYLATGSFSQYVGAVRTVTYGPTASFHPSISSSYYNNNPLFIHQYNTSQAQSQQYGPILQSNSASINLFSNLTFASTEMSIRHFPFGCELFTHFPHEATGSLAKIDYFDRLSGNLFGINTLTNPYFSSFVTFQRNIFKITGSLTNCNTSSLNYEVDIFLSGSNVQSAPLYVLQSSGSGTTKWFTFDWYEDINKVYAVSTYPEYKVSNQITASNSNGLLTIDFGSTATSGEKSFTFIG